MKKYDFLPTPPAFLQDFCKKAQWRAKKLRERGSNTALPTGNGGGGSPDLVAIRSRFGRDLQTSSWRFVPIRSISARVLQISARFGASIRSCRSRFGRDLQTSSWRFVPTPCRNTSRHHADTEDKAQTQKKPDSSIGESGFSYRKASRALNLPLVPLSNTRASVRSVLLGLARRSCIVTLTSARRHIVHYTLQNMRTRERS